MYTRPFFIYCRIYDTIVSTTVACLVYCCCPVASSIVDILALLLLMCLLLLHLLLLLLYLLLQLLLHLILSCHPCVQAPWSSCMPPWLTFPYALYTFVPCVSRVVEHEHDNRSVSASAARRNCASSWKTTSTAAITSTCLGSRGGTRSESTRHPKRWKKRTGEHASLWSWFPCAVIQQQWDLLTSVFVGGDNSDVSVSIFCV